MVERENRTGGEELASLLKKLPLETCRYECDVATKERGWRAPKDKVFRISGHFVVHTDQSISINDMSFCLPHDSVDIIKEKHSKEYQKLLKKTKGNEEEALKFLIEDDDYKDFYKEEMPPKFFDGKWLVMEKSDGTEPPNFFVKKDVEAWYNPKDLKLIKDLVPDSETITECRFIFPDTEILWEQDYAEPVVGKCKIELIDSPDEGKKLYIPKTPDKKRLCSIDSQKLEYDVIVSTKRRPGKSQEKELKDFTEKNKDLAFSDPDSRAIIHDDFSIAYRKKKEIIIPKKINGFTP